MLFIVGLIILAIYARKRLPLFSLGILWFFCGHVLESTVYPLELMFLHRNYLPSLGILLAVVELGMCVPKSKKAVVGTAIIFILAFSYCTRSLAYQWSDDLKIAILEAVNSPNSVRANFHAGQIMKIYTIHSLNDRQKEKNKNIAIEYFNKIRIIEPNDILGELGILQTYLHIREIPPEELINKIVKNLPTSRMSLTSTNVFVSYLACIKDEDCYLEPDIFKRLIHAALSTPKRGKVNQGKLYMMYAEYLADCENDIKAAIAMAVQGMIAHHSLNNIATLASYYERGEYYKEMKRTIRLLDSQDILGLYSIFIREANNKLNAQTSFQKN
jgi:hypothetical protein